VRCLGPQRVPLSGHGIRPHHNWIPVATVVGMVADGITTAEIVEALPDLQPEDVEQALRYAAEAVRERELPLRRGA